MDEKNVAANETENEKPETEQDIPATGEAVEQPEPPELVGE